MWQMMSAMMKPGKGACAIAAALPGTRWILCTWHHLQAVRSAIGCLCRMDIIGDAPRSSNDG